MKRRKNNEDMKREFRDLIRFEQYDYLNSEIW